MPMDLAAALAYSRYATAALAAHPEDRAWLDASARAPFDWHDADATLAGVAGDPTAVAVAVRVLRRRLMLHTIARDLAAGCGLSEVVAAVTRLAETTIRAVIAAHHAALVEAHGTPRDPGGRAQELVVIGMGKLGGGELNVSSDIDLVFTYPDDGETDGERGLSNGEFFDRLGRRVIGALHDRTSDGYVFRVDMRLRPYGDSGPLTVPYVALEQYLIAQGRAWERYAWLKARPLTGTRHDELAAIVTPFVFRKYLDYDAYEGLRDIHRQIREQGKRRDYAANVKLGPGGIREIEFIVQALQIVRGGREPALRTRGTLPAIAAIAERGLMPAGAADELRAAYVFLRDVEHRLQYRDDAQTQTLPADDDERAALAQAACANGTTAFDALLDGHRGAVSAHFAAIFGSDAPRPGTAAPGTSAAGPAPAGGAGATATDRSLQDALAAVWRGDVARDTALATLGGAGFDDPAALADGLERVKAGARYLGLPGLSQQRFDALVPQLLAVAATAGSGSGVADDATRASAQEVFLRLLSLLETVARRSAYLALLSEHPAMLPRLAQLMGASAWAAAYLNRHPILLDELLDARVLLAEPDWEAWRRELARLLADQGGDAEGQMDALRHFQHAQAFRLLAQDLAGTLTVERLADHLSALADIILQATVATVWTHLCGPDAPPPRFAIVGYGKLGGKELGYASDLDLVFLFDGEGDDDDAAPERYARLARRLVTWLNSTTAAGQLYDTDLRLRPDGAAGLMVSSMAAFRKYQRTQAWPWEHQALTRARFVTGDAALGAAFESERDAILRLPRDSGQLAADVVEMRVKMAAGHPNPTDRFDLKHDAGGMVDVEFAVQYIVLAHAAAHPALTRNLGNIALLRIAGELGLVPPATAAAAADAYRDFRRLQHQIRLTDAPHARVDPASQRERRAAVAALWRVVFGAPWRQSA
jgi:glutamate-ammonia-ligase adenylyltransferase